MENTTKTEQKLHDLISKVFNYLRSLSEQKLERLSFAILMMLVLLSMSVGYRCRDSINKIVNYPSNQRQEKIDLTRQNDSLRSELKKVIDMNQRLSNNLEQEVQANIYLNGRIEGMEIGNNEAGPVSQKFRPNYQKPTPVTNH